MYYVGFLSSLIFRSPSPRPSLRDDDVSTSCRSGVDSDLRVDDARIHGYRRRDCENPLQPTNGIGADLRQRPGSPHRHIIMR